MQALFGKNLEKNRMAESYGEILARLRAAKGWSMYELARRSGLRQQSLWNLETGTRQPRLSTAVKVARAFEVSLLDMVPADIEDEPVIEKKPAKKKGK